MRRHALPILGVDQFSQQATEDRHEPSSRRIRLTHPAGGECRCGADHCARPVDVAVSGGYWMVASDGGIFSFDAPFYGAG